MANSNTNENNIQKVVYNQGAPPQYHPQYVVPLFNSILSFGVNNRGAFPLNFVQSNRSEPNFQFSENSSFLNNTYGNFVNNAPVDEFSTFFHQYDYFPYPTINGEDLSGLFEHDEKTEATLQTKDLFKVSIKPEEVTKSDNLNKRKSIKKMSKFCNETGEKTGGKYWSDIEDLVLVGLYIDYWMPAMSSKAVDFSVLKFEFDEFFERRSDLTYKKKCDRNEKAMKRHVKELRNKHEKLSKKNPCKAGFNEMYSKWNELKMGQYEMK